MVGDVMFDADAHNLAVCLESQQKIQNLNN